MTSWAWLPGLLGGRLGHRCSRLELMRLGSLLGLAHERMGRGPRVLPGLSPAALLLSLDRGFAWLAAGPPAFAASCLKQRGAPSSTDSCSVVPGPRRVWASGRPVGQSLEYKYK